MWECLVLQEVTSEQSDIGQRVEMLTQILQHRKAEADTLRKQQRQQQKMKLRAKEDSLRRQIEVCRCNCHCC